MSAIRGATIHLLAAALTCSALVGCGNKDHTVVTNPTRLTDTGWFTTSFVTDTNTCTGQMTATDPEDGAVDWYWRDRPEFLVDTADHAVFDAFLESAEGDRLDTTITWDDTGLRATLSWDGFLEANTTYVLGVIDCSGLHSVTFGTSEFGKPLEGSAADLVGNTYLIDLVGATWVQPAALAGLIALYFTTPVLLGVTHATDESIDLLGAPGIVDPLGIVSQDTAQDSWDFPITAFEPPFVDAQAATIHLSYGSGSQAIDIPVEDFVFQATLSADGTRLGGGYLEGRGDTRNLGTLLGDADLDTLCVLAEGLGVSCVPCRDGMPYCLDLVGNDVEGTLLPGLELTP